MKRIILNLIAILSVTFSFSQIKSVDFEKKIATYTTQTNETVDVNLDFETKKEGEMIDDDTALQLLEKSNEKTIQLLSGGKDYYPLEYKLLYKWKKNGKHKYTVWILYKGTKNFGDKEENEDKFVYNHKLRETAASAIRRATGEISKVGAELNDLKAEADTIKAEAETIDL